MTRSISRMRPVFRGPTTVALFLIFPFMIGGGPSAPGGCAENPYEHLYYPDNGQGTVNLPPNPGPGLIGPIDTPIIFNGLNSGDSIILVDLNLMNSTSFPISQGGSLCGDTQHSQMDFDAHLEGTGTLNGWDFHVPIRVDVQIDAAGRPYFASQQSFDVRVQAMQGSLSASTPDFNNLDIRAGYQFGLPSDGRVNLRKQPDGTYATDFGIDVTYRINYVGGPASPIAGRSGSQVGQQHIQIGGLPWNETGDAPQTIVGQNTIGSGNLAAISGNLSSSNDVDMFKIGIPDPSAFSATTTGGAQFDTQLFLFNLNGTGVTHNDDDPNGPQNNTQSRITGQYVPGPGVYVLGISGYNRDPVNNQNLPIWNDLPYNTERPPDGPGAPGPLSNWVGGGASGPYTIKLTGCRFVVANCSLPQITQQPAWRPVPYGGQATFNVVATGSGPLSYQWFRNGQLISCATGPSLMLSNVQDPNAGDYYVKVSNLCGSVTSNSAGLSLYNPAAPPLATPGPCDYIPETWKQAPVPWNRLPNPANVPNAAKIDNLIDLSAQQSWPILINYKVCITQAHLNFLSSLGGTSIIEEVFSTVPTVAMTGVSGDQIQTIAAQGDVAMIEEQDLFVPELDTSLQTINVTPLAPATPASTVASAYPDITGAGVGIAILDTGVDNAIHATFKGAFVGGYHALTGVEGDPDDDMGHGTHVASIALGRGTGPLVPGETGVSRGVAPGAKLIDVKVIDPGDMVSVKNSKKVMKGLQWTIMNQRKYDIGVINASIGSVNASNGVDTFSQMCNRAVAAGIVFIASAGNSYPAAVANPPARATRVISVAACDDMGTADRSDDEIAFYSQTGPAVSAGDADYYGQLKPEVTAPGGHITFPGGGTGIVAAAYNTVSGSTSMYGTSMAAPHVAGLAALALQAVPTLNPESFRAALLASSERKGTPSFPGSGILPEGWNVRWGWGEVDGFALLNQLLAAGSAATDVTFDTDPVPVPWLNTNIGPVNPPVCSTPNQLYAKIQNAGPNMATNVRVNFGMYNYSTTNPPFIHVGTVIIASLAPGERKTVHVDWFPNCTTLKPHQCMDVEIGYANDTAPGNNKALRNLDLAHSPVYFEARNFVKDTPVTINFVPSFDPPTGWSVQITPPSVSLAPGDNPPLIEALPIPPDGAMDGDQVTVHIAAVATNPGAPWPAGDLILGGVSVSATMYDCNGNGIDDWFDIQNGTSVDVNGNHIPDECEAASCTCPGDVNGDGKLDGRDIARMVSCYRGSGHLGSPGVPGGSTLTPPCVCADLNADGRVDDIDIAAEVGILLSPQPGCP